IHSITSSAATSNVCGIARPSAFAVLRLTTSSNFTVCWTGKSPGFSPLSIDPAWRGETRHPPRLTAMPRDRLHGWGERTRTRKCRSEKISLKHPMNPLAFQNILGREIFRGGAANDLTCGSGAKTGQFEIDCPPGRALTTGVLARMVALFPPASPWWHGLPRLSKSATACSLCAGLCAQRERVCGYEHR